MNVNLVPSKKRWPVGFYDCFSHKDGKGHNHFFPDFCPKAMICSNSIVGQIHSKLIKEPEICCGVGQQGLCLCVILIPFAVYTPASGFGVFCCISNYYRRKVAEAHMVEDDKVCCVDNPALNPACDFCYYGFHYPCSLFQVVMSLDYWAESPENEQVGTVNNLHYVAPAVTSQPL